MPEITYREALKRALREEMQRDPTVVIWGEDVVAYAGGGAYGVTAGLAKEFPGRVRDTPIAEEAIVGVGLGAAMGGLRPVCEIMTVNFTLVAWDQIVNHVAKQSHMFNGQIKVPMVIRTPNGHGRTAATHSQNFDAWFASIPSLKVVAPATPYDAKGLLKTAIRDDDPVIFLEHLQLYSTRGEVPDEEYLIPIGEADYKRRGKDITIVTWGRMTIESLKAAKILAEEGIDVEIVDLRTLRPMDVPTILESVRKTNRAIVVEEGWRTCGLGAEIAATIQEQAFNYLDAPVARVAGLEVPMPYARNLERATIPFAEDVVEAVRAMMRNEY
ncbi:MAG: alpha-ketoacid dehydrogenase subunit beta [Thermoflexales bacterium]|nr:alpha-ketoacid dehydrogenase subunit beta [Thermoflexales bacterium]MCS7325360.1 alpha-ketoacid dehydrogenase subunit beta [Thermoflexales bacterium]MCX7939038.1 alpha-ketoacid dehydrogenase subunit beta [Thermoflexales bacterium]MDW8054499.1 alpha-ketoacid dehydrogenase subunit beta [Anaerolineae bacterium]MDW8292882.1 alpha-ketoacid dehydrogenase subunit beta [Anaerolineae bacterium]